jgi:TetR/AcrR family transcriptional regulator, transcriptional repressor for nem operon
MNDALDKAARIFRERGYHATSIADLTAAMELAPGSIYKAFKDKDAVFKAAFDREAAVRWDKLERNMNAVKTGRDRIREVLVFYAEFSSGTEGRRGCLVVGGAAELSTFQAEVAQRVTAALHKVEALMAKLIRQGQADGSIAQNLNGDTSARLMLCVLQGMRVIGKTGRNRADMVAAADAALKILD